jgi:DNA-binding NarL/FixJ family response regulator
VTIRVAIVDDQQLVRAGFRMLIGSQDDMEVVTEAGSGEQAIAALAATPADVVLMDVRMPGMDGLAATAALAGTAALAETGALAETTAARIIILTTFDLDEYLIAAIKAGASGFLLKDAPPEELLGAIRRVHEGDAVLAPSATRRLVDRLATSLPDASDGAGLEELTDREREVLVLMARGRTNQEICGELFLAEPTVKAHVGRVLAKLGARDRVQAVVRAYETGLVRPGG